MIPMGLSGAAAIQLVRDYANEQQLPGNASILTYLNRGVEQVAQRTNGIFKWGAFPTVSQQTYIQLSNDVWYIASCNFSSGANNSSGVIASSSPLSQGSLVYPMFELEQGMFMDAAAGFPAVGFGPPQAFFIYQDKGLAPGTTLPVPAAPVIAFESGTSNGSMYEVVLTYLNPQGETTKSNVTDYTPGTTQQGVVVSPQGIAESSGYNVYVGNVGGPYYLQNASPVVLGTPYTLPGTPTLSGTQPPAVNGATASGQGGAIFMQLYPSAMLGQVNVYYRSRPQLWGDTTGNSWTDLDTSAHEAVVVFATMRTLAVRGRSAEAQKIWKPEYDEHITYLTDAIARRTHPRSGQVRDVRGRAYPQSPPWWLSAP